MKDGAREKIVLAAILLLALAVRFVGLGDRVMHADEANQAVKLGYLLDGAGYRFDPADHHGPTLYYFAAGVATVRGETSLASLTESGVRSTTALFGTLAVFLAWWLARGFGGIAATATALFAAISPISVYYSRYFIQETLLAAFFLAALACGREWLRSGKRRWAAAAGVAIGCMLATKMSALLFGGIAAVAVFVALKRSSARLRWSDVGIALALSAAVAAAFYSSFGRNPAGILDAVRSLTTMADRATTGASGHEKPAWYYLKLFVFHRAGGYYWDQTLFLLLALVGAAMAWRISRTGRVLGLVAVAGFIVLSLAPYKTPWQMVVPASLFCVLAGGATAVLPRRAAVPMVAAMVLLLGWQAWQAAFFRPADIRNPLAYVHSSPDIARAREIAVRAPAGAIKVIAEEYWPLPWYLKQRPEVGYWQAPPDDCDARVIFVDAANADTVRARLRGNYRSGLIGLRPGVIMEVLVQE